MLLRSSTKMRAYTIGALLVALPGIGACFWDEHKEEEPGVVASVAMNPASANMKIGQILSVTARPITIDGTPVYNKTYVWTSNDTAVASVAVGGVVTAKKVGSAVITADVDGFKGNTQITVTP